jgi:hypothetical protein
MKSIGKIPLRPVLNNDNTKSDKFMPFHLTDLLIGCATPIPNSNKHLFFCDFDEENQEQIMKLVGNILFNKYKFGNCYLIKSGKGYHVINFSEKLTIKKYANILEEMGSDPKYIEWVKDRVNYGVLRLSRRSSHRQVPKLIAILKSPHNKKEDEFTRDMYFNLLSLEDQISNILRVKVFDCDKKN